MTKVRFCKSFLSFEEQVNLLVERGMTVDDPSSARRILECLNYYRLEGYWIQFKLSGDESRFVEGTKFEDVLNLYIFDRELRLVLLDAIEKIEVTFRTQWAYHLAHAHGSHAHLDSCLFNPKYYSVNYEHLHAEVTRSREIFVKHHINKYQEPLPPLWVVCEVMSLGLLSRWYYSQKDSISKKAVASYFGLDVSMLCSWLKHLCEVRNLCAHHSRIWDRKFKDHPQKPKSGRKKYREIESSFHTSTGLLYNSLVVILYLLESSKTMDSFSSSNFKESLMCLIQKHQVDISAMGFPEDWKTRSVWAKTFSK